MNSAKALSNGLIGSITVTLINEAVRRFVSNAPRLDVLGERAVEKSLDAIGQPVSSRSNLYPIALAGDLISNSLYYSMTGSGKDKNVWLKGALLGLTAGIGAVTLPEHMGLGKKPTNRTTETKLMTIAWYLAGGLASAAAAYYLTGRDKE